MLRRWLPLAFLLLFPVVGAGCDPGSAAQFTRGRSEVTCIQNIPACPGLFAACTLNETTYTQQRFPAASPFRFLVTAMPRYEIAVSFYFLTQEDSGYDTRILWYEPGCTDMYSYHSDGADLFAEATGTNTLTRSETIYEGGEHLVEIFTDMQTEAILAVATQPPSR